MKMCLIDSTPREEYFKGNADRWPSGVYQSTLFPTSFVFVRNGSAVFFRTTGTMEFNPHLQDNYRRLADGNRIEIKV